MQLMDYQPNLVAGSLRSRKTRTIGLIIPDSANIVFSRIGQAIELECSKYGQNVIFCNSSYNVDAELKNIDILRMKMVDGIIILPASNRTDSIEKLLHVRTPFVVVNADITYPNTDLVYVNNENASFLLSEHLIQSGCKKICYIDRFIDHFYSIARKKGFMKALEKYGIQWRSDLYVRSNGFYYSHGYSAMERIIKSDIEFDSVLAYNDIHAIGAMRALYDNGITVPNAVKIAGFDNIPVSEFQIPSLTTVNYPTEKLGMESFNLLSKRIEAPDKANEIIQIDTDIVLRESTKK